MTTFIDKDEFEAILQSLGVQAINEAGIGNQTGRLRNTLRVDTTPDGYVLEFEPYGLYLDAGVQGTQRGITGRGYSGQTFRFSGQYKMIGGNLGGPGPRGFAIRTAIYRDGIAAKPWIDRALFLITEEGADLFERQITENFESYVEEEFPRAVINVTL